MKIKSDEKLNPALKEQLQGLRGIMLGNAEKTALPDRFKTRQNKSKPSMFITDTETKRETEVPLFAYNEVRRVLTELFSK